MHHFVSEKLTPEYPNPVLATKVPNGSKEQLEGCRKPPSKWLAKNVHAREKDFNFVIQQYVIYL